VRRNKKEEAHTHRRIDRHVQTIEKALAEGGKEATKLLHHPTYKKYVRREARKKTANGRPAGRPILDRQAIAHMKHLAGRSVIGADCCEAHPLVADDIYRNLFAVEAIFRQLKTTIEIGPIRHRRGDRIRAHVMIAVMALNLGRWLELKTGMTLEYIKDLVHNLRVQQIQMGAALFWERTDLEPEQRELFSKLSYEIPPKRFTASVVPLSASSSA